MIEKAARLERRKLTEYCVQALTAAACQTFEEYEPMMLSEEDRKIVFEATENPPEPNDRLRRAVESMRRTVRG